MYSSQLQGKAGEGSVQFNNTKGRLQIVFSYPVEENGEIKRERSYISTGYIASFLRSVNLITPFAWRIEFAVTQTKPATAG
ncbi:hypothetical protein [Leptolyngbya sp. AN10]|uniref:hypothetical protein n=1 Tax=Leptolyngbya sp. AN10 TaxID=3423365 RepID=UPI003D31BF7C